MITGLINIIRFLISNPELGGMSLRVIAFNQVNISNIWNLVNEVLRVLLILILIKLVNRILIKSRLSMKELGLHINLNQALYMLVGLALMSVMFFISLFINTDGITILNSLGNTFSSDRVFLLILTALTNAFWQEVIFRGYLQKRLIVAY